jgi:LysR family transcriptional activator of nhaA
LSRNYQLQFLRPALGRTDVEVILRSGSQRELLLGLEAQALDVVLTNLAPPRDAASQYLVRQLAEQEVHLVGLPRLIPDGASVATLLRDVPLILPTPETSIRGAFDAMIAQMAITPLIAAEVDDMAMMRLLTREGVGLAVIPPIVARDELSNGDLHDAGALPGLSEAFFAVTLPRRFPNPLVGELLGPVAQG